MAPGGVTARSVDHLIQILQKSGEQIEHVHSDYTEENGSNNEKDAWRLALALALNRTVLSLRVEGYTPRLLMAVAKALKHNATLQSFTMEAGRTDVGDEIGLAMAEALRHTASLQSFTIKAPGNLGDGTLVALAEALKHNASLRSFTIDAWRTNVGDETWVAMAEALKHNATLRSLTIDAWRTNAGDETGVAMAEALRHNASLESFTLNMSATNMSDETVVAVAEALKHNATLQSFTMEAVGTNVGEKSWVAMAEALKRNATLRSFTMVADVGDETGVAMAEALKHNATLRSFTMHAGVGDETRSAMECAMEHNVTLQKLRMSGLGRPLVAGYLERNRAVQRVRHVLSSLARLSADTSFRSPVEKMFRRKVLAFFLPEPCRFMPIEFLCGKPPDNAESQGVPPSAAQADWAPAETFVAASRAEGGDTLVEAEKVACEGLNHAIEESTT